MTIGVIDWEKPYHSITEGDFVRLRYPRTASGWWGRLQFDNDYKVYNVNWQGLVLLQTKWGKTYYSKKHFIKVKK